jgi:2-polyprenyl-6-methoxyphenol hydroxylase-like FAD-dependent oxidoreductase
MTDVVIIGAGPAGSSVALRLARNGFDVTLVERSRFPRTKVCGDYLCAAAVGALADLGVAEPVLAGAHPIYSILLSGFGEALRFRLPGAGALSLDRATLDQRLLAAARGAGARVARGSYLWAEEEGRLLRVVYRDERGAERRLDARALVGADGAWSIVAQRAGMVATKRRMGRWAVGGQLRDQRTGNELEMYVGAHGYYARNPLNAFTANSMLVLPKPAQLSEADAIVENITGGERRFDPEKIDRPVAVGPLRYRAARVIHRSILLTGDAAELLDPFTGQGVATALAVSLPASEAVGELLRGDDRGPVAARYSRAWQSIVEPRRRLSRLVDAVIRSRFLRSRALTRIRQDAHIGYEILASISGVAPARDALEPRALVRLLAS